MAKIIRWDNYQEVCKIIEDYNFQCSQKLIDPKLIEYLDNDSFNPNKFVYISRNRSRIFTGIMVYSIDRFCQDNFSYFREPATDLDYEVKPLEDFDLSRFLGLRNLQIGASVGSLILMESFKFGMGRNMVNYAKSLSIDALLVPDPLESAIEFYEKMGFVHTGLYNSEIDSPIMIWMRNGHYT